MDELKRCPFCGGKAVETEFQDECGSANVIIDCMDCSARTSSYSGPNFEVALRKATAAWNKRAEGANLREVYATMREELGLKDDESLVEAVTKLAQQSKSN